MISRQHTSVHAATGTADDPGAGHTSTHASVTVRLRGPRTPRARHERERIEERERNAPVMGTWMEV